MQNEELQRKLKEQSSGEDRTGKRPRIQEGSDATDYSQIPQSSGAWKGLVDILVKRKHSCRRPTKRGLRDLKDSYYLFMLDLMMFVHDVVLRCTFWVDDFVHFDVNV